MPIPIVCQSVARSMCIMHYCVNMTDWRLHSVMALHRYVELYTVVYSVSFCSAMLCISAAYAVVRWLCVCPLCSWILSKWISISSKKIHRRVSQTVLVSSYQTSWRYSDGYSRNGAVECRWVGRNRDSEPLSGSTAGYECLERQVQYTQPWRTMASW